MFGPGFFLFDVFAVVGGFEELDPSPSPFGLGERELDRLAHRLWLMKRRALRAQFERVGVPVVEWRAGTPLAASVEEVTAFRRHARHVRVS